MKRILALSLILFFLTGTAFARSEAFHDDIYDPGKLKPRDSVLKVKVGDAAPEFALPSISGKKI